MCVSLTVLTLFAIGILITASVLRKSQSISIYAIFFVIYGALLFLTQYLFIDGVNEGYFLQSDAYGSFYVTATMNFGPTKWDDLVSGTLFKSLYSDYPLFACWINFWKLIGFDIGVTHENMRLFLRLQNLLFAPGILAIMAKYFQEIGMNKHKTLHWCIFFGLFSYLFLTSVVYSRDLHVAFFYTLAGYYCISPRKHRFIYLKFVIIALICFGLRPENGMFAIVFPIYYAFRNTKPSGKLILGGLVILCILLAAGFVDSFINVKDGYNARTAKMAVGGLYSMFNSLPVPLNIIFNSIYSFIMPFPLIMYTLDRHIGVFGLFSLVMPFINVVAMCTIYVYARKHKKDYRLLYFFLVIIVYTVMCCSVEPNVRRAFAIIPTLFMLFAATQPKIPSRLYDIIVRRSVYTILLLNIPAILYLIYKGTIQI